MAGKSSRECPVCHLKPPNLYRLWPTKDILSGWRPSQHGGRDPVAPLEATTGSQDNHIFALLPPVLILTSAVPGTSQ